MALATGAQLEIRALGQKLLWEDLLSPVMLLCQLLSLTTLNCHCADPVVCVPSSFFIGDNGIPLEVIAGSVSVEELVTRIHKVKQVMLTGWIFPDGAGDAQGSGGPGPWCVPLGSYW